MTLLIRKAFEGLQIPALPPTILTLCSQDMQVWFSAICAGTDEGRDGGHVGDTLETKPKHPS